MASAVVRPKDVYWLPIPGRNGQTKDRYCVILESYPTDHNPDIVIIVAGCSDTYSEKHVRVEIDDTSFRLAKLPNATTFHARDIYFYDARSPRLMGRRHVACPHKMFLDLRRLLDQRIDSGEQIVLLPPKASDTAHSAAVIYSSSKKD